MDPSTTNCVETESASSKSTVHRRHRAFRDDRGGTQCCDLSTILILRMGLAVEEHLDRLKLSFFVHFQLHSLILMVVVPVYCAEAVAFCSLPGPQLFE